ncbi:MAG: bifunctional tetrahydrofolate synthase/dihydrofolate synthase [Gammaproteobacteria bacterium]|nr:bifunctional tetrahydrofolate synthase/dihydrofolate synthase [Gammaproteobacteria bacterium]
MGAPIHEGVGTASGRARFDTVDQWLRWQETLNPRSIDLGLDRCRPVFDALNLGRAGFPVVSVAGTNGKGSCVAMIESVLARAGYRVGSYTSPHLTTFNETIRVAGREVSDEELVRAFQRVDEARDGIALTWFEFRTLAAGLLLEAAKVDIAVMEVGLGGRLDAVNLFDADLAVITAIGLDHRDWLGDTRDDIGREKAGICRPGRPVVCGDPDPPRGLLEAVAEIGARPYLAGTDFCGTRTPGGWRWTGPDCTWEPLPEPGIPGPRQLDNASAALMAIRLLAPRFPLGDRPVADGLAACCLRGRLEFLPGSPETVVDVAHNPDAADALAEWLRGLQPARCTRGVLGMYADKDIGGVARALGDVIDAWYVASLPPPRGATGGAVETALREAGIRAPVSVSEDVAGAIRAARGDSETSDRIVVFGSFETVRQALALES